MRGPRYSRRGPRPSAPAADRHEPHQGRPARRFSANIKTLNIQDATLGLSTFLSSCRATSRPIATVAWLALGPPPLVTMKFSVLNLALVAATASAWLVRPPVALVEEEAPPPCAVDSPLPCTCPEGTEFFYLQTWFSWGANAWSVYNLTGNCKHPRPGGSLWYALANRGAQTSLGPRLGSSANQANHRPAQHRGVLPLNHHTHRRWRL